MSINLFLPIIKHAYSVTVLLIDPLHDDVTSIFLRAIGG